MDFHAPIGKKKAAGLLSLSTAAMLLGLGYFQFRQKPLNPALLRVADDLKKMEAEFNNFKNQNGAYPNNTPTGQTPQGMEKVGEYFKNPTPIGGSYDWEGPESWGFAGIAIQQPTHGVAGLLELDQLIDDGKLYTGKFRFQHNSYIWIIQEKSS